MDIKSVSLFSYLTSVYILSVSTDELSSILKKLSLEKYQPIFEEQEVGHATNMYQQKQ